jgi:hypothetical protein
MKKDNLIKSLLIFGIVSGFTLGVQPLEVSASSPSPSPTASASPSPSPSPKPSSLTQQPDYSQVLTRLSEHQQYSSWGIILAAIVLFLLLAIKAIEIFWRQPQMQDKYLEIFGELLKLLEKDFEKILNIPDKIDTLSSNLNTNLENITKRLERLETKPSDTLPQKLTEIERDLTQIKDTFNKPKDINTQDFARQLIEAIKNNPDLIVAIATAVSSQQGGKSKSSSETEKLPRETSISESPDSLFLTEEEKKVVSGYNNEYDLSKYTTDVSPTQDTVEEARTGRDQIAYLKPDQLGMYWIIKGNEGTYLVPNRNRKPNIHQMNSVQDLFDCHYYQAGTTDPKNFQLVKPGKVASETIGETWILQSKGILEFQ